MPANWSSGPPVTSGRISISQLARMGAKTIVAVSRNPGQRLQELAESLAAEGIDLVVVAADATDEAAMSALFDRFGADLPPLEGVYLAALAGQPVLLTEMTNDDVTAMFAPKLDAAALLHRLSLKKPVRHFVLFSSISGLTGSRWLAHYTATSGYLDALAYARRVMGLAATTVNWGLWKSLADAEQDASQVSKGSGLLPMDDEVAIGALPLVMSPAAGVHSVVVGADWPLLAAAYRTRGSLRIVEDLLPAAGETTMPESEFRIALRNCAAGASARHVARPGRPAGRQGDGTAAHGVARSLDRLLPARDGLVDERDAAARVVRQPR